MNKPSYIILRRSRTQVKYSPGMVAGDSVPPRKPAGYNPPMHWFLAALVTGAVTFAATNVDDIFILTLFFSQAGGSFRRRHIVAGQYLGFTALVLISLLGFLVGLIIPTAWIGLLGVVPILLGVRRWMDRAREDDVEAEEEVRASAASKSGPFAAVMGVAAVTFANGGDNIGVYTPLFASSDLPKLIVMLAVFYLLLAVWCYAGHAVARRRVVAHALTHYGHLIVPFVLVGLGVYIIVESGTLTLLGVSL
jgi:cadmium resistance transport/sequestration family protein